MRVYPFRSNNPLYYHAFLCATAANLIALMSRCLFSFFTFSPFRLHRYYRLWIYTCNAVLLMAVIIFCCVAGKVLLADYRRLLINGLNLGQPSFLYAYLALLVQSGKFYCIHMRVIGALY